MFDEKEHIPQIVKGDLQAFRLLVEKYRQLVFYVIDRLTTNEEDKKDISQEVFIKVHKNLYTFNFKSKLSTWIASIAYRTALNHIRDQKRSEVRYSNELEDLQVMDQDPGKLTEKKDLKNYILNIIKEMPVRYKTVLTFYHFNEFSYEEIAAITGMPEGTVKNYLFRARNMLKNRLKPHIKDE